MAILTLASIALCFRTEPVLLVATGCIPCGVGTGVAAYVLLHSVRLSVVTGLSAAGAIALSSGFLIAFGWLSAAADLSVLQIFVEGLVAAALMLWQLQIAAAAISAGAATDAAAWTARDMTLRPGIASLVLI